MTSEVDLYAQVADLAPSRDPGAALMLGGTHWHEMQARDSNPHDAETCRLLSLAAIEAAHPSAAELWRTRALVRFALSGWHEGVGAVVMGRAFTALARRNDDYVRGQTIDVIRGSEGALKLIDELQPFLRAASSGISVGPQSPSQEILARFYYEKRGFLMVTLGRWDEALTAYDRAAAVAEETGSARGVVKVQAGRALVMYLSGAEAAGASETAAALHEARALGEFDIVSAAEHNLQVNAA